MDRVGLQTEQVVEVHRNRYLGYFDRMDLEARCRSCCKEDLGHRHYGLGLHHNLRNPFHAQIHLFHGVVRHLCCLGENGDGICRDLDLAENRHAEQGCHMVHRMGDVDSFQNLK